MKIREILPKDDNAIFKLIRTCLKDAALDIPGTAYFDESIKKMSQFYNCGDFCKTSNATRKYFVLVDENDIVAGGAGFAEFNGNKDVAELQKLYIDQSFRGKGFSYQLIQLVEKEAKLAGYKQLYLETHHNLPVALHLYQKLGYKQIDSALPGTQHSTMDYFFIKEL